MLRNAEEVPQRNRPLITAKYCWFIATSSIKFRFFLTVNMASSIYRWANCLSRLISQEFSVEMIPGVFQAARKVHAHARNARKSRTQRCTQQRNARKVHANCRSCTQAPILSYHKSNINLTIFKMSEHRLWHQAISGNSILSSFVPGYCCVLIVHKSLCQYQSDSRSESV